MTRGRLFAGAKLAVTAVLIWFLIDRISLETLSERIASLSAVGAALATACIAIQVVVATHRWRLVATAMEVLVGFAHAFRITIIGLFFNQTLPSAFGGDAVRIWLLTRDGQKLGKSVNVVLGERVFALVTLVGLMGMTLPLFFQRIDEPALEFAVSLFVAAGIAGTALFVVAADTLTAILRRWRLTRPFGDLAGDFRLLFTGWATIWPLWAWSIVNHFLTISAVYVLGQGLGAPLTFVDTLIAVPVVLLATALPVSIGGWGVREGVMVAMLSQFGVMAADALAISICLGLVKIAVELPGGIVWILDRRHSPSIQPS